MPAARVTQEQIDQANDTTRTAAELLNHMSPAKREAAVRGAIKELAILLDSCHAAVGFPKTDRWTPMLAVDLEAVRQKFLGFM